MHFLPFGHWMDGWMDVDVAKFKRQFNVMN